MPNAMEVCLIIDSLIQTGQTEKAKQLAEKKYQEAYFRKYEYESEERIDEQAFNVVLGLYKLTGT